MTHFRRFMPTKFLKTVYIFQGWTNGSVSASEKFENR